MNSKAAVLCWLSTWLSFRITKEKDAEIIRSPAWTHQLSPMRAGCPFEHLIVLVLTLPKRSTAFTCRYTEPSGSHSVYEKTDAKAMLHILFTIEINTPPRPQTEPCWCRWTRSPETTVSCFDIGASFYGRTIQHSKSQGGAKQRTYCPTPCLSRGLPGCKAGSWNPCSDTARCYG